MRKLTNIAACITILLITLQIVVVVQFGTVCHPEELVNASFISNDEIFFNKGTYGEIWAVNQRMPSRRYDYSTIMMHGRFLSYQNQLATNDINGNYWLWDVKTGKLLNKINLHLYDLGARLKGLNSTRDGDVLSTEDDHQTLILKYLDAQIPSKQLHDAGDVKTLAISSDNKFLIAFYENGRGIVWDLDSQTMLRTINDVFGSFPIATFAEGNKSVVLVNENNEVKELDLVSGKYSNLIITLPARAYDVKVFPENKTLIAATYDSKVRIWDLPTGKLIHVFNGPSTNIWDVAISPNGHYIVTADHYTGNILLWDASDGTILRRICSQALESYWIVIAIAFDIIFLVAIQAINRMYEKRWSNKIESTISGRL